MSVPPDSTNAFSCDEASSSSVSRPQVIVPRARRETQSPVAPSRRCSMCRPYPDGWHSAGNETAVAGAEPMRLGLNIGYWGLVSAQDNMDMVREAERLGFSAVWAAEAYGNDAATVLTWIAAKTEKIEVGSAIFQIPARTPAMAAMTAATIDTLSQGRFRLRPGGAGSGGGGGGGANRSPKAGTARSSTSRSGAPVSTSTSSGSPSPA